MTGQALRAFEFSHRTRIVFGPGVWLKALSATRALGEHALLVTGADSLARLGLEQPLLEEARRLGLRFSRAWVPREPDLELADSAAAVARASGACAVLAIGGGSALDVGKAAAALARNPGSARDYLEGLPGPGPRPFSAEPLPVVCVPTTSGTGSEVTKNAVLQVPDLQVKRSMRSDALFPHSAFVDPLLAARAPRLIRAGSGFDALTHLIEAFCSRNASSLSDALARDGIPRALRALQCIAKSDPEANDETQANDEAQVEAASELALAATLGGICLANAGLGAAHGLIAPLGGLYPHIPHGAGLACLLPATLRVNASASRTGAGATASTRLAELARLLGGPNATLDDAQQMLVELRRSIGLPSLASYGTIDIDRVIESPSGSLKTNPVPLTGHELRAILEFALEA